MAEWRTWLKVISMTGSVVADADQSFQCASTCNMHDPQHNSISERREEDAECVLCSIGVCVGGSWLWGSELHGYIFLLCNRNTYVCVNICTNAWMKYGTSSCVALWISWMWLMLKWFVKEFARISWKITDFCVHAAAALRFNCAHSSKLQPCANEQVKM